MWDYAKLAQLAKNNGGPARYLATIKMYNFQQGILRGKLLQRPKIILAFGLGAVVYGLASKVPNIISYFSEKPKEKKITDEEAEEAEKTLIEGMEHVARHEVEQSVKNMES